MDFEDMIIEAASAERKQEGKTWQISFTVRVLKSPAGESRDDQTVSQSFVSRDMQDQLTALEQRTLDQAAMIRLGRTLGTLLLPALPEPDSIYDLFVRSLDHVGPDRGIRLRLRLPPLLAALPWEYMYVDRAGNPDSIDGFLALNPRVAIVRHEVMPRPSTLQPVSGEIKVLAALASADGMARLDLAQEEAILRQALDTQPGIVATYLQDAELKEVLDNMHETRVFHYAGHGTYAQKPGDEPGVYSGTGSLALFDQSVEADQLAVNLSAGGVRLAVLGGCETGRRDGVSVWSGIAPALMHANAQIPAVVANQFSIKDTSAIEFSRAFYKALVAGRSVEEAVAVGRIAVYNADEQGRDWGVPVLYLREGDGKLFAGVADPVIREQARKEADVTVGVQVERVGTSGYVAGAEVGRMRDGKLAVTVKVGDVAGTVVGAKIKTVEGGDTKVDTTAETVTGNFVGAQIDSIGGTPSASGPTRAEAQQPPHADEGSQLSSASGSTSGSTIGVNQRFGTVEGTAAGTVVSDTNLPAGTNSTTSQEVNTVAQGGTVVGHVSGSPGGNIQIGGEHHHGDVVSGDQFNMSGNFSGAILNIKSKLNNVSQSIAAAPHGDDATKARLQALIEQLSVELQKVPAEKSADAEAVAETAKAAVEQATKEQPNKTMVQISAEGLKQAAQNLAAILPTVLPLATQIADTVRKMVGM